MTIPYAIPPLSPVEAFEWIRSGEFHRCCDAGRPDMSTCADCSACKCLESFLAVLRGEPGEHDRPEERPKTWEEMDEGERRMHRMLQNSIKMIERDLTRPSIFGGLLWDAMPSKAGEALTINWIDPL